MAAAGVLGVHLDSYDHYNTAQIARKITASNGAISISAGNGRAGSAAVSLSNTNQYAGLNLSAPQPPYFFLAFAVKVAPGNGHAGLQLVAAARDNISDVRLVLRPDMLLNVEVLGSIIGRTTTPLRMNAHTHITLYLQHHTTLGKVVVWMNEVEEFRREGTAMLAFATARNPLLVGIDILVFGGGGFNVPTQPLYFADFALYLPADPADAFWESYLLGDVKVTAVFPTAEGDTNDYTPSAGTDNAAMVDEAPADDDTTHVEGAVAGDRDVYHYDVSALGAMEIVQAVATAKDTGGGLNDRSLLIYGSGPTESTSVPSGSPTSSYTMRIAVFVGDDISAETDIQSGTELF